MSDSANAKAAMALYDGTESSIAQAVNAINEYYQEALDPENGEFLLQVVGIPRYTTPLILKPVWTFADIYLSMPRARGLGDG